MYWDSKEERRRAVVRTVAQLAQAWWGTTCGKRRETRVCVKFERNGKRKERTVCKGVGMDASVDAWRQGECRVCYRVGLVLS